MKKNMCFWLLTVACAVLMTACSDRAGNADKAPTGSISITAEPVNSPTPTPTNSPTPTDKPTVEPTPTDKPIPTNSPTPTAESTVPPRKPLEPRNSSEEKMNEKLLAHRDTEEELIIQVDFGDYLEEGWRFLRDQYPEEYRAYYIIKESEDPITDKQLAELGTRGREHAIELGVEWRLKKIEDFLERHPEMADKVYSKEPLQLKIPYATAVELGKDAMVTELSLYERFTEGEKRVVVDVLNGKNVYDVGDDSGFQNTSIVGTAGEIEYRGVLPAHLEEIKDDEYFLVGIMPEPGGEQWFKQIEPAWKASGIDSRSTWLSTPEGKAEWQKAALQLTEGAFDWIREAGWIITEEVMYGDTPCVIAIVSKKQLTSFRFPEGTTYRLIIQTNNLLRKRIKEAEEVIKSRQ